MTHLAPLIRDLAVILGVAGLISLLFARIKQPVVLGYILAGMLIGPYTPPFQLVTDLPNIQTWAELGVIFLMFSLGLEFSFRKLSQVGGSAALTASLEVAVMIPLGFLVGRFFGWSTLDSVFLGAMLSISSTTIIIKALEELGLKKYSFAQLIFAVLIVEDLIAILLLVGLGTIAQDQSVSAFSLLDAGFRLTLVVSAWILAGYLIVPRFMKWVSRFASDEVLTILALGFCLALVVSASHFGYSTALGAFIMGSILAESPVVHRVERLVSSFKGVFGAVFFVSIGMLIDPKILWNHSGVILALCAVTVGGKILSTGLGAFFSGQDLKNSTRVGMGLAQIGEFSFIIAQLGKSLGVTGDLLYPVGVAVSLVTTFTTPYLIRASGPVGDWIERAVPQRFSKRAKVKTQTVSFQGMTSWLISAVTLALIFAVASQAREWSQLASWSFALFLSGPFVWAMIHFGTQLKRQFLRGIVWVCSVAWILALSAIFFSPALIVKQGGWIALIVFALVFRVFKKPYLWFERVFLSSFQQRHPHGFEHLAPWDESLVSLRVEMNSHAAYRSVRELAWRNRWNVNIVAIQRGSRAIVPPLPEETLLPGDELILLGAHDRIQKVEGEVHVTHVEAQDLASHAANYQVETIRISPRSPLVGRTIRESKVREDFSAIVVGIDRLSERLINPDSEISLQLDDLLWIAGEKVQLARLKEYLGANLMQLSRAPGANDA